jgi:hypothetical protein
MVKFMVRRPGFPVELKSRRCSEPIILLKISDAKIYFRLAIRYELRKSGSHTIDKAQVIENKRSRLQKLIEMFEHQADSYLLRHKALDNVPIALLTDYSEFDNVDALDDSESQTPPQLLSPISPPAPHFSDDSSIDQINAEDLSILLPSSLGWQWCIKNNLQGLAEKEAKLRIAQANDAIHSVRLALGFKSALFHSQVRPANTQRTKTRAWDTIHSIDATAHQHARNYSMAREAYLQIQEAYPVGPELPQLQVADLRVGTTIINAAEVGQRNCQLPWIWSFRSTVDEHGTWMHECNLIYIVDLNMLTWFSS